MIRASGGSKSRLAKAAGAEVAVRQTNEKLHAVVARSTFSSQNVQNTPFLDHFLEFRCRKIARWRSTFSSQSAKNLTGLDHVLKFRCGKIARRYGAKHISTSKCTKHTRFGPLFEVQMWKHGSTFASQNLQNTPGSDHFLQNRCG